jgi:hypothetical protein
MLLINSLTSIHLLIVLLVRENIAIIVIAIHSKRVRACRFWANLKEIWYS